jgi:hypothetical protein
MSFFDELGDDRPDKINIKPFHTVKGKDSDSVLKWLKKVVETLEKQAISRNSKYRKNLEAYRGTSNSSQKSDIRRSERQFINRVGKFVINHLYDMTETRISQMTRIKPTVDVLPTNDEFEDKNSAKAVKFLINHLWYINDMDAILQKMQRNARIFGEAYCFIEWDPDRGDLHPLYVKARDNNLDLDILDEEGNSISKIDKDKPIYIGDIKYEIEVPWRVYLQRQKKFEDVEYCFRVKVQSIEDVKKDYPDKKSKLKIDTNVKAFNSDDLTEHLLGEETVIYEFFHKKTKYCPQGYYCKFTKDVILEYSELPYSHNGLPFERLTDMDIPEQLNGVSAYEMIRPIQNMHDNLSTLLAKNIYLMGHAKWIMPRGACKIESLGNDNTIVQYQGPQPPQMLQTQPNPAEAYAFRNALRDEMGQIYGVQGVSRGTPPAGITAGVALQFLNEQEQERATTDVGKHNVLIQNMARKTIAVAGDYYQPDDGRMLRIVGKDNKYAIRHFDSANLSKDYDVRMQVGSALPESKAGKIQRIVEIMQMKPDLLSNERWVDLLELGNSDKMNTLITAAVRAAESENEDLLANKPVMDPQEYEDHIIHWKTHVKAIQSRTFKEETPSEVREHVLDHISLHEFVMVAKAKASPAFEAKLAELPLFPIFPNGFVARSREHQEIIIQGEANRGDSITGMIPGKEVNEENEPYPLNKKRGEKK